VVTAAAGCQQLWWCSRGWFGCSWCSGRNRSVVWSNCVTSDNVGSSGTSVKTLLLCLNIFILYRLILFLAGCWRHCPNVVHFISDFLFSLWLHGNSIFSKGQSCIHIAVKRCKTIQRLSLGTVSFQVGKSKWNLTYHVLPLLHEFMCL